MNRSLLGKIGIWSGVSIVVIVAALVVVFFSVKNLGSHWDG